MGSSFINALVSRLDAVLPNRMGHSLAEVELDSQFIITTNLILKNCKPNEFNGHQDFFSDILKALLSILEKLNIDPQTQKLIDRSTNVLSSTVILTRLLRIIAITKWDPEGNYSQKEDLSMDVGINFDIESNIAHDIFDLYAHKEPPAVNIDTGHVLGVLFKILSPEINIQGLSDICKFKPVPRDVAYSVSPQLGLLAQELRSQILEIDSNILILIRYIAASNPPDYANFVKQRLFSYVNRGENIPLAALQRYACLLMFVYCTPNNTSFYLKLVYSAIPYIRSMTWKQLFLHYESINLRIQCINKPGFYSNVIYAGSSAEQECKIIFDYISTAIENESNTNTSLLSWYVVLCPSGFDELLLKSGKLKQVFNKRVKFLHSILKDSHAGADLDCFESLISIFLWASLLPENEGAVRKFSNRYLDDTFQNFSKMRLKCVTDSLLARFRSLHQKLFTAAIAINPDKYISIFIGEFQEKHELQALVFYDKSKTIDSHDLLEVIMALSCHSRYRDTVNHLMRQINATLSNIMHCCAQILCQKNAPMSKTRSLCSSSDVDNIDQDDQETNPNFWTRPYGSQVPEDQVFMIQNILRLTLDIYTKSPLFFMQFQFKNSGGTRDEKAHEMLKFSDAVFVPLNVAIHSQSTTSRSMFKSACKLSMRLLQVGNEMDSTDEVHCISTMISHNVIYSTCEVIGSLSYPAFKEYYISLKSFLLERIESPLRAQKNDFYQSKWTHIGCERVCTSLDKLLMLCLCTHDIQFFSLLKLSIKAHSFETCATRSGFNCFQNSLAESFCDVMGDDIVFTGFVSLHKKFKSILADFKPTRGLYEAWLMIYNRWVEMVDDKTGATDDNFTFKHYTEFLATTSGCFLGSMFEESGIGPQELATTVISSFYDRAVALLNCEELFIRVVIREALSTETHSEVYQLIYDKIMNSVRVYKDVSSVSAESVLFFEEAVSIFTSILNIKSEGAFILAALLPEVIEIFFEYVDIVPNLIDQIKLKLRLCKLTYVMSALRDNFGISGAYKLRNKFAKIAADWLDSAASYSTDLSNDSTTIASSNGRASDVEFLQIELAAECAKSFSLQLQNLVLTVPDGTKESNFEQAKILVFSNFFSIFYKIFQKFNGNDPSPLVIKSKFKIQTITEHVLKAISNMLRANVGIGLEFAIPLGYHENNKIRSIFLDIFATTLSAGKLKLGEEEFSDSTVYRMSEIIEVYGAAARVASPAEHNLLATSLNGLFGYTKGLDKLFLILLEVEMQSVNRASDIFRGNSTLTRLMSIFAKEYGAPYLSVVLRPFVEEMVQHNVIFEVERDGKKEDVDLFFKYLRKLVKSVVNSIPWVPEAFKFICFEIHRCVGKKFDESSLIAVGSFLFLRFFCPAIVCPESFFDITSVDIRVKRSLMQIVKAIQYMANGSILNLKWASLATRSAEMNDLNAEIFAFMEKIAAERSNENYVFHVTLLKPLTCLRYVHKFFYAYFVEIRHNFLVGNQSSDEKCLQQNILAWRKLDKIMSELGNPKPAISLQGTKSYKSIDAQSNIGNSQFTEFMAKMSAKNIETSIETPIVKNFVFHDGTPVVVVTFRYIKEISYDVSTMVYLLLETVSQIWENQFYCVIDLTQFYFMEIFGKDIANLLKTYAPRVFFRNCKRTYYYNLPRPSYLAIIDSWTDFRPQNNVERSISFYSEQDSSEMIESLCLSEATMAIPQDVKFVCKSCKLYDDKMSMFTNVTLRLGRLWLLICFERMNLDRDYSPTKSIAPVEVLRLTDLIKCEISNKSGENNEFTLYLNKFNYQVTLVTPQREEVLRFLYFAMLRSSKKSKSSRSAAQKSELEQSQRFSALATLLFHGLLQSNDEVRVAASKLLKSFSSYYNITFDSSSRYFSKASFPVDMTDFVVSYSSSLADHFPQYSHEFLRSFFANFDKFTASSKISGVMYISPWVVNLHEHISKEIDGVEKMSFIVRQLCKITTKNPLILSFMKELIWKKIFRDMRMTTILVDELVAIAMEIASESDDWNIIISVFHPSVELCGELVSRLHNCIYKTKKGDSAIVIQSKISEISILIKICSSLFFDSFVYGSLYLLDVFLFCTLFIDRSDLDFGHDLQSLVLSTIQSFSCKPLLGDEQVDLINETVEYFSSQRAKMLFGLTTKERGAHIDFSQNYERALSFEHLCDYLNNFMSKIGSADDKKYWISRWSSLSKDIAFSDSFFQMRAYTIVCTLARSGISDSVGGRIMEVLTGQLFDDPASFFEGSVCFLRLMQGLVSDSVYLPLLVWVIAGALLLEFPLNYQAMISSLGKSFEKMIFDEAFTCKVFAIRSNLEPLISLFEERVDIKIRRENYEFVFLFLISKGLIVSQVRHTSINTIRRSLLAKGQRQGGHILKAKSSDDFVLAYLLVYYLSVPDSTFQTLLSELGLEGVPLTQLGRDKIPDALLDGICSLCESLHLGLVLAAHIFIGECEQIFKFKFIALYAMILERLRDSALMIYHIIQAKLEESFINAASNSLTNDISVILMRIVRDRSYNPKIWQEKIAVSLRKIEVFNVDTIHQFELLNGATESVQRMTIVRQMFYRNLCSVTDGLKLEKF
ncbi:hypothetical protein METBIDRAFT_33704 [Metschnikowia bicuspidata var. bicuspidata NRRL YB-4993]|uniref:Ras-GAP domain-containing protein n=1 Tax=Metschnikowia bicuspidata var. bicuspidata NRRL YB-4993 TaxID=869754 RepID=A0A1A0H4Z3_9ASCO|nr:hypothetical protein METBIDRAFT_33704 [Metschnikowia bicuspidata var. bicuspidata NRRL YB-4993]OBA19106.1 hypothetical protein METBIDRAFT_33704 [Metschnikowia bicuspidata var. bicuspidata NRRL YB-4993]